MKSYTHRCPTMKGGSGCGREHMAELTATQVTLTLGEVNAAWSVPEKGSCFNG